MANINNLPFLLLDNSSMISVMNEGELLILAIKHASFIWFNIIISEAFLFVNKSYFFNYIKKFFIISYLCVILKVYEECEVKYEAFGNCLGI